MWINYAFSNRSNKQRKLLPKCLIPSCFSEREWQHLSFRIWVGLRQSWDLFLWEKIHKSRTHFGLWRILGMLDEIKKTLMYNKLLISPSTYLFESKHQPSFNMNNRQLFLRSSVVSICTASLFGPYIWDVPL